ncbi:Heat shock protein mitochondrial [Fasciola hepatica]|uniref:10 kDa heat shock protein, mitochondrial n=1 Tax=Fasciola hepatica TaxID=6192 RepID=A0A4E0R1M7_FASHE|nr:Heat shock protein mitochondrial [Fasciola hepatica]
MAARAFKKFLPLFDRVLVQRFEAEKVTKGGIMIPEKAKGKVLEATVIAHGPGYKNEKGVITPLCVTVGDKVFLPEYGGTKVVLEDKVSFLIRINSVAQEYFLFRESDILAKFEP